MTDRDSRPSIDPLESVYLELLAGRSKGWDDFRRDRPELAAAVERLQDRRAGEADSPAISDTFCERLASLYGDETAVDWKSTLERAENDPTVGDIGAGRYRILSEIARGGMGIVFEVHDDDLDRVLAMKVIQEQYSQRSAGSTTATSVSLVRRFLREAKITAQLDHPGVVPVYDVGLHPDGCVYFTMRLVRGDDLRDILEVVRGDSERWTTGQVVDVLLKVCDTVAFCHDRGVIHRDLKPANIRVGRYGEVYVMDWGLARVLAEEDHATDTEGDSRPADRPLRDVDGLQTVEGQVLGTPAYMSPEQALGKRDAIGPASDVYSIGAMLYTLLAGTPPYFYDGETPRSSGVLDSLSSGPPRSLREFGVRESERLIEICERAMARDLTDRYGSVQALADALREHRELERRALRVAELAHADAERSRRVSAFLVGLFEVLDPNERHGGSITVETLLDRGAKRLERDLASDPLVRAAIERTLGTIHHQLGKLDDALRLLESALALQRRTPLADELEEAETLQKLGNLHMVCSRLSEARSVYERALEFRRARLGDRHPLVAETQQELGIVVMQLGDPTAAEALCRDALSIREDALADDDPDLGSSYHNLGFMLSGSGSSQEGIPYLRRALEIWEASLGDHMSTASCLNNLSRSLSDQGEHDEAHDMALRALAMRRRLLGERHPLIASTIQNLATQLSHRGRYREAADLSRQALTIRLHCFADDHSDVCVSKSMLGTALARLGKPDESAVLQREVLAIRERVLDPENRGIATTRHNLGVALQLSDDLQEAERCFRASLEHRRRNLSPRHPETATTLAALGTVLADRYRIERDSALLDEAEVLVEESLATRRALYPDHHITVASSLFAVGRVAAAREQTSKARAAYEGACTRQERDGHDAALGESQLAWAELELKSDPAKAKALAAQALTSLTVELPAWHPTVERARSLLAATEPKRSP